MSRSRYLLVWSLVGLVAFNPWFGGTSNVAAAQNGPVWASGNSWTYHSTAYPNTTQTMTIDKIVVVAVGSTNYTTWHVWTNLTTRSSSGNTTFTIDGWLTTEGWKLVKTQSIYPSAGTVTATYTPPEPVFAFPLSPGATWSGNSSVTTSSSSGTTTTTMAWSGQVISEGSVTVPAGTFPVAVVRSPFAGGPYVLSYYAESAGWAVKLESYDNSGVLTDTFQLSSYRYSAPAIGGSGPLPYWIPLVVAVAVSAVVVLLIFRLRRGKGPPIRPEGPPEHPPKGPPNPPPQAP